MLAKEVAEVLMTNPEAPVYVEHQHFISEDTGYEDENVDITAIYNLERCFVLSILPIGEAKYGVGHVFTKDKKLVRIVKIKYDASIRTNIYELDTGDKFILVNDCTVFIK